ncbi:MAG: ATP-binding protein [Candidatus Promineifilaceae bacterium]
MLPSGTVIFLFSDIEKSTRLWEQHPHAMRQAVARHDALLRRIIEDNNGYVFKTVGDAFCATFGRVSAAVECAVAIQQALLAEEWGDTPIWVRLALHAGEAEEREGDYFGPEVNRVARLLSAGHGGQILVSEVTVQLAHGKLPGQIEIRDLGSHYLKDISSPEHIFQMTVPGLLSEFPALNTVNANPNNLPVAVTSFIGRETEIEDLSRELSQPEHRLLTLTGPGGTGKTRLSLQVAAANLENYADGEFFVPLAAVRQHDYVLSSIIESIGIRVYGGQPPLERLKEFLAERQMLLLLDNFEQVVEAAPLVSELLASAPSLTILVTSRVPLHLYGERIYQVEPLDIQDLSADVSPEQLARIAAVQLFVDRAGAVKSGFVLDKNNAEIIARICAKLDGLPLAIELVAARIRFLSPQAILDRIDNRMALLVSSSRDLPPRQSTIRAAIDWSYQLLTENEQTLFRRLAVFSGGAAIEAIESVCQIERADSASPNQTSDVLLELESLLEHSLLYTADTGSESHFSMLETIREFALERLEESGEAELIRRQHAEYFFGLAKIAELELWSARLIAWLDRLETEHNNLRTALSWLTENQPERGLEMAVALLRFWHLRGHHDEGRDWLSRRPTISRSEFDRQVVYVRALDASAYLAWFSSKYSEALLLIEQAFELRKESIAGSADLAFADMAYANILYADNQLPRARAVIAKSVDLYKQDDNEGELLEARNFQAYLAFKDNDLEFAREVAEENLAHAQRVGEPTGIGGATSVLGHVAANLHDYETAVSCYEKSLAHFKEVGDLYGMNVLLRSLANVALFQANYETAKRYLDERLQLCRQLGNKIVITKSLCGLGIVSVHLNQNQEARAYFAEGLQFIARQDPPSQWLLAECLSGLALLLVSEEEVEQSAELLGTVDRLLAEVNLDEISRSAYEKSLAAAKEQLDEETFDSQIALGRSLTIAQAVDLAQKVNKKFTPAS